jgi:hypothetical protein
MLPDFIKIKNRFIELIDKRFRESLRQDPLFAQIKEEKCFEGNKMSNFTEDGEFEENPFKQISGEISLTREEVIAKGPLAYIENISRIAEDVKKQKAELLFSKINEVTNKTGNVVSGQGQPFSHELFIAMLDKMQIDFDPDGNPYLPTIVVSPQLAASIASKTPQWESNPEYKKQFEELIERKRKDWNDRESNRKLVD